MHKNDEIASFIDSNLKLEGMTLSVAEKQAIMSCLAGRSTFNQELKKVLAKYKKVAA